MKSLIRLAHRKKLIPFSLMALTLVLTGCNDQQQQQQRQMPPPAVSVVEVNEQEVGTYNEFVARTESVNTVELRARVEGFLIHRDFREGDDVAKDQLLFQIDPKPYEVSLKKAQADLAGAKADLDNASKELKRSKDLFRKGFISQADLDTKTSTQAQAEAAVQVAEAGLESAKLNLSYTSITAPFAGQIGLASYSVGNLVGPTSESLATLKSIDPIYVNFQVNEQIVISRLEQNKGNRDPGGLNNSYDMRLILPNGNKYPHLGTFNFAGTTVDPNTGTVTARAAFPNPNGIIVPGLYVNLIVEGQDKTLHPLIPQASVQESQSGYFVLVLTPESTIETRQVTLGRRIGPMWVVDSGLKAGEKIVVEGLQKVRAGEKVRPSVVTIDPATGAIQTPKADQKPSEQKQVN